MAQLSRGEVRVIYDEYLATVQAHRFDELGKFVQPDFVLQGQSIGLSGFVENLRAAVTGWPDLQWKPWKIAIDTDEQMICVWFDMYYKRDGQQQHFQEIAFYTYRDGKMAGVDVQFWGPKPEGGPVQSSSAFDRNSN